MCYVRCEARTTNNSGDSDGVLDIVQVYTVLNRPYDGTLLRATQRFTAKILGLMVGSGSILMQEKLIDTVLNVLSG